MSAISLKSYAKTSVSVASSRESIDQLLEKIGAVGFRWSSEIGQGRETLEALIEVDEKKLGFRLTVTCGDERERRQMMRALYWYLKTKVEAIQFGLVDLEREFLPYLIMRSGQTVAEELAGDPNFELLQLPSGRDHGSTT